MKLSKKQLELVELVEKCGYIFRDEIYEQQYPTTLIDALIRKGVLVEYKNKITSVTAPPPPVNNSIENLEWLEK